MVIKNAAAAGPQIGRSYSFSKRMLEGLSVLSENAPHRRSHTLHVEQLPATKPHSAQVASRAAAQTGLSRRSQADAPAGGHADDGHVLKAIGGFMKRS